MTRILLAANKSTITDNDVCFIAIYIHVTAFTAVESRAQQQITTPYISLQTKEADVTFIDRNEKLRTIAMNSHNGPVILRYRNVEVFNGVSSSQSDYDWQRLSNNEAATADGVPLLSPSVRMWFPALLAINEISSMSGRPPASYATA